MTMTIRRAKQLLPYIEAFANGKTVQKLVTVEDDNKKLKKVWENMDYFPEELFDKDCVTSLRIKPTQIKYRPFANAEECWNEMQKHQPFGWTKLIGENKYSRMTDVNDNILYSEAIKEYTFADGSVFGIKEESEG